VFDNCKSWRSEDRRYNVNSNGNVNSNVKDDFSVNGDVNWPT
jgi:hypothetical protein